MDSPDPEQLGFFGRVIAGAAGFATVAWGAFTFTRGRAEKAQAVLDSKLDKEVYERHQRANEAHLAGMAKLLEDRRLGERDLFRLVQDNEKTATSRHIDILNAIGGIKK